MFIATYAARSAKLRRSGMDACSLGHRRGGLEEAKSTFRPLLRSLPQASRGASHRTAWSKLNSSVA